MSSSYSLVNQRIEALRPKLLDTTRRNPLIQNTLTGRASSYVALVDEKPQNILKLLSDGASLRIVPLPPLSEDHLPDEGTTEFLRAFENAQQQDDQYIEAVTRLDFENDDRAFDKQVKLDRDLKDKVRTALDLPPRPITNDKRDLIIHAKIQGVNPSTTLPEPNFEAQDDRHDDDDLQTLLLPQTLESRMQKIYGKQREYEEERGVTVTYLVLGYLRWSMPDEQRSDEIFKSPLLLIPVEIDCQRTSDGEVYSIVQRADPEFNPVLKQKLEMEAGLDVSEIIKGDSEEMLEVEALFDSVQIGKPTRILKWEVKREATLGIYPFPGIESYVDSDTSSTDFSAFPVLKHLMMGRQTDPDGLSDWSNVQFDSNESDRAVPHLVLDADSSQYLALMKVASGENVALEGPPGSGKSQTIVNAIANALYGGKRVLFVAQKTTALDVVYARLQALKLDPFVLPMRGSKTDTKEFYDAVQERIEMQLQRSPQEILLLRHQLQQQRDHLASYINLVTSRIAKTEITVHQFMGLWVQYFDVIAKLPLSLRNVKLDLLRYSPNFNLPDFISCQKEIASWAEKLEQASISADSPWSCAELENVDYERITLAMSTGADRLLELEKSLTEFEGDISEAVLSIFVSHHSNDIDMAIDLGHKWRQTDDKNWRRLMDCPNLAIEPLNQMTEVLFELEEVSRGSRLSNSVIATCGEKSSQLKSLTHYLQLNCVQDCIDPTVQSLLRKNESRLESFSKAEADYDRLVLAGLVLSPHLLQEAVIAVQILKNDSQLLDLLKVKSIAEVIADLGETHKLLNLIYGTLDQRQAVPTVKELQATQMTLEKTGFFGRLGPNFKVAVRNTKLWLGKDNQSVIKREDLVSKVNELLENVKALTELPITEPSTQFIFGDIQSYKQKQLAFVDLLDRSKSIGLKKDSIVRFASEPAVEELCAFLKVEDKTQSPDWSFLEKERDSLKQRVGFANKNRVDLVSASEFCYQHGLTKIARIDRALTDGERWVQLTQKSIRLGKEIGLTPVVPNLDVLESYIDLLNMTSQYSPSLVTHAFDVPDKAINMSLTSILPTAQAVQNLLDSLTLGKGVTSQDKLSVWSAQNLLAAHLDDKTGFECLIQRRNTLSSAAESGLSQLLVTVEAEKRLKDIELLGPAMTVHYLRTLFDQQYGSKLLEYSGTSLDLARQKLQEVDRQLRNLAPRAVSARTLDNANPPKGVGYGLKSEYTDGSLINHELGKQRRMAPRKLLKRARGALSELFPCWMMAPGAVAQLLPRDDVFDLVIIDEASQMTPETAISALMRAKQVLISGDTNQLPPTNFFQGLVASEDEDEDIETTEESILELANTQFYPKHRLQWHYRSRHESLIAFSNHYVYENELVIFPSPDRSLSSMGVSLVPVHGTFYRGINPVEAQVMVEHITKFMREQPERTLGVVLMNKAQMEQVEAMIVREAETDHAVASYIDRWDKKDEGLQRFFVKNLENVQGDERDVIFIGTTYGPDPNGKFYKRFGPINGTSGKRRLNVLFTRAKEQIITFTSIPLDSFEPDFNNQGARLLKLWLQYSSTGRLGETIVQSESGGTPDSPFEEHVISAIESVGYQAIPQIGVSNYFIDIGVKHPDYPLGYLCGFECDGATYHSAKSARDRDRLRQEVLERLGWELYRIWSTDWFRDPLRQIEKLKEYLDTLLARKVAAMPPLVNQPTAEGPFRESVIEPDRGFQDDPITCDPKVGQALRGNGLQADLFTNEDHCRSISRPQPQDPIDVGSKVLIRYLDGARAGSTARFWLTDLPEGQSITTPEFTLIRPTAPLAQALIDSVPGDVVSYPLKDGYVRVEVLEELD